MPSTAMVRPQEVPAKVVPTHLFRYLYKGLREPRALTSVSNRLLRAMGNHPFVRMIVERRKSQAVNYCREPRFRGDTGYDIMLLNEQRLASEDEERRRQLLNFLKKGGFEWKRPQDGRKAAWMGDAKTRAIPFAVMINLLLEDSLIFDSAGLRLEPGANVRDYPVACYRPVNGANIRLADPEDYVKEYRQDLKYPEFVVLDPNQQDVKYELGWDEFAYWVRNPTTIEEQEGYGRSELEWAVDILTGLISSYKYNVSQFTENKLPRGIIQVPDVDEDILDEFLTTLEMNIGGPGGQWSSIPVIRTREGDTKPTVQWIPLGERPTDIQFQQFIVLSIGVLCNLYKMSSEEIGFQSFTTKTSSLQEADPETKILHGEDTGFVPLMTSLEDFINDNIISKYDDGKWRFVWKELGKQREERDNLLRRDRLGVGFSTIEEERTWADKPMRRYPLDLPLWQKTQGEIMKEHGHLLDDPDNLYLATERLYAAQGGSFSLATQVPLSAVMMQMWSQEMMQRQQVEEQKRGEEEVDPWAAHGLEPPEDANPPRFGQQQRPGQQRDEGEGGRGNGDERGQQQSQRREELRKSRPNPPVGSTCGPVGSVTKRDRRPSYLRNVTRHPEDWVECYVRTALGPDDDYNE